jgi:hypothetical protein
MYTSVVAAALIALPFPATPNTADGGGVARLKEARIAAEFTAGSGEVALVVSAEGETGLDSVEIRDPSGLRVAGLASGTRGRSLGLYGFRLEVAETNRATFFATYPPGPYEIRARTRDGRTAIGTARLAHSVPLPPIAVYPRDGELDVPSSGLSIRWLTDPDTAHYQVGLEEGETDLLAVRLGAGTGSFTVPDGVLAPGHRYKLEIGAVGSEGNCTFREVWFRTR